MKVKKAFTMIELIFVIVIISILASVVIPRLMTTRDDSKISACLSDIATLIQDLSTYYTSQGSFTVNANEMTNVEISGGFHGLDDSNGIKYIGRLNYICQDKNQKSAVSLVVQSDRSSTYYGYEYSLSIEDANSSNSLDKQLILHMKKHNLLTNYKISGLRYKD